MSHWPCCEMFQAARVLFDMLICCLECQPCLQSNQVKASKSVVSMQAREVEEIEALVNGWVQGNSPLTTRVVPLEEARKAGGSHVCFSKPSCMVALNWQAYCNGCRSNPSAVGERNTSELEALDTCNSSQHLTHVTGLPRSAVNAGCMATSNSTAVSMAACSSP